MARPGMYYDPELGYEVPIPRKKGPTQTQMVYDPQLGYEVPVAPGENRVSTRGQDSGADRIAAYQQMKERLDAGQDRLFPDQSQVTTKSPVGSTPDYTGTSETERAAAYQRWKERIDAGDVNIPDQSQITTKSPVGSGQPPTTNPKRWRLTAPTGRYAHAARRIGFP